MNFHVSEFSTHGTVLVMLKNQQTYRVLKAPIGEERSFRSAAEALACFEDMRAELTRTDTQAPLLTPKAPTAVLTPKVAAPPATPPPSALPTVELALAPAVPAPAPQRGVKRKALSVDDKKIRPCRFFVKNTCTNGESCEFGHFFPAAREPKREPNREPKKDPKNRWADDPRQSDVRVAPLIKQETPSTVAIFTPLPESEFREVFSSRTWHSDLTPKGVDTDTGRKFFRPITPRNVLWLPNCDNLRRLRDESFVLESGIILVKYQGLFVVGCAHCKTICTIPTSFESTPPFPLCCEHCTTSE